MILDFWFPEVREQISMALSHLVCGTCYHRPKKLTGGESLLFQSSMPLPTWVLLLEGLFPLLLTRKVLFCYEDSLEVLGRRDQPRLPGLFPEGQSISIPVLLTCMTVFTFVFVSLIACQPLRLGISIKSTSSKNITRNRKGQQQTSVK